MFVKIRITISLVSLKYRPINREFHIFLFINIYTRQYTSLSALQSIATGRHS